MTPCRRSRSTARGAALPTSTVRTSTAKRVTASASGAGQPTMTLGASEFAAAPNGLAASPFSLAPMPVADARSSDSSDGLGQRESCCFFEWLGEKNHRAISHGIYRLRSRPARVPCHEELFQTLSIIKRPGFYGWQFLTAGPSRCIQCFVYCDGSKAS